MDQREIDDELRQPGAQELLTSATLARLAYDGADGFPRVVPAAFLWTGRDVVVCTAPTAPKARSIAARPHVAVTIDTGDTPQSARALLLRGTATVEVVDGVAEEYLAAATKAMDPALHAGFEQAVRAMYPQMARIAVAPLWARFFDFGAGRLPRFLQDLAAHATGG